jgi:two-component system, cell cycle sensor histidine kinase and response regulator CckA
MQSSFSAWNASYAVNPGSTLGHANDIGVTIRSGMRRIERREWWLWSAAVVITLLLTIGLISFIFPFLQSGESELQGFEIVGVIRSLVGLVLLFDVYVIYQQLQIYRMRQRLIDREEAFRLITENAADMIAVVDGEGHRLYNSPAYEKILGYTAEELLSTSAFEQVHPDDRPLIEQAAHAAATVGTAGHVEFRMRHKNGAWRTLESVSSAIMRPDGKADKIVVVSRDITDRKRLEDQFRQAQKMEAIGRLSGGVAHDFNNVLGVIIGYAEVLQENTGISDPDRSCIEEILRASKRAASLIRQLLAFSRQQVLELKVLDLNQVIVNTEKMLRRLIGEDIRLSTHLENGLGHVRADEGQMEQVILNLAINARDAMPDGGELTISTTTVQISEADTRRYSYPFAAGKYALLTVTDAGIGMDSATQARIFEPFFTTKEKGKGTGLGLSTVYGVVKQSGGYIEVASEPGCGASFKIHLPIVTEPIAEAQRRAGVLQSLNGSETILLVEDETALRVLTRNVLERFGYKVLEASDGIEACQVARKESVDLDLLLTDIVMPGMNGLDLAQCLATDHPDMRILYMSGYTGQGIGQGILPAGSNFIAKPFSNENLASKVREVLEGTGPALQGSNLNSDTRRSDEETTNC